MGFVSWDKSEKNGDLGGDYKRASSAIVYSVVFWEDSEGKETETRENLGEACEYMDMRGRISWYIVPAKVDTEYPESFDGWVVRE